MWRRPHGPVCQTQEDDMSGQPDTTQEAGQHVGQQVSEPATDAAELSADTLIEEVSIDGMCGVY